MAPLTPETACLKKTHPPPQDFVVLGIGDVQVRAVTWRAYTLISKFDSWLPHQLTGE